VRQEGWRLVVKTTIDKVVASVALLITAPLIAVAAIAIRIAMGRPVFFRQERPGRNGRPFRLAKLRTMDNRGDGAGRLLPDEERLTRIGRVLRSLSIDELPQLWNVIRGDMSLVGPRPLLMEYLDLYTPEQARRHEVLPGITGWAQINGRNALSWEEKFALDAWYVGHWSLTLDATILARTIGRVLRRRGISSPGRATMPNFTGSRRPG